MKLFLEEETEIDNEKIISVVKKVKDKAEAIKNKTLKPCFLHICYHDEKIMRPCKRVKL